MANFFSTNIIRDIRDKYELCACAAAADVGREAVECAPADQEEDEGDEEEKEEQGEEEPA